MNDKQKVLGPGELTQPIVKAPSAMIELAIEKGADLDKLEKIMELQERWEANEAKKAYHLSMARFKVNPPIIDKDQHVKFSTARGITEYDHASLFNVERKITEALSPHGLNITWTYPKQTNELLTCRCTLTHELGHSEFAELSAPPDDSGSKNPIQALGSASEYLRRYTLLAVTGLATKGIDNDAHGTDEYITEEQIKIIELLAEETNSDVPKWLKIDSIDKILAKDFSKTEAGLRAKIKTKHNPLKKLQREPGQEG